MRHLSIAFALAALAACQSNTEGFPDDPVDDEDPSLGNETLGIAEFVTTETPTDLVINGVDAEGKTVAEYRIHIGMVEVDEEQVTVFGRRLDMLVDGRKYFRTGEEVEPMSLVLWGDQSDYFVLDAYVSRVLARWGITYADPPQFEAPADGDEAAYSGGCSEYGSPMPNCSTYVFCQSDWGSRKYQLYRCDTTMYSPPEYYHWSRYCDYVQGQITPCGKAGPAGCGSCGAWYEDPYHYTICAGGSEGDCAWD